MWLEKTEAKHHKISGIYQLRIGEKWFYIGSSYNIHRRFIAHRYELNKNIHRNQLMQNVYNKYKTLSIRILYTCPSEYCIKLEQWCIDASYIDSNLNLIKKLTDSHKSATKEETRIKLSKLRKGRIFSEETKRRISESKMGSKNAMFGVKQTSETIAKRVLKLKGKKRDDSMKSKTVINRKDRVEYIVYYNNAFYYCFNKTHLNEILKINVFAFLKGKTKKPKNNFILIISPVKILTTEFYNDNKENIINLRPSKKLNESIINLIPKVIKDNLIQQFLNK